MLYIKIICSVESDIHIFAETADDIPGFAQAGSTLEQCIVLYAGMENSIKDSSYPPVFLDGNRVNVFAEAAFAISARCSSSL